MKRPAIVLFLSLLLTSELWAVDYRVEPLDEAPPADAIDAGILPQLTATGVRVYRGSRKYCDVWLCKQLEVAADFTPTEEVLYPFRPGQLIGAVRYSRRGSDFRDQDIGKGVYTLRYAQQPIDGAHVGTSPTRDFLLLLEVAKDKSPAKLEYKKLAELSAEAVDSTHPAMLSLQRIRGDAPIRNDAEHSERSFL